MYSQAYSHAYFTNTCAHTDTYIMGKADVNFKIEKEERKKNNCGSIRDRW